MPHINTIDMQLSTYSDRNITQNARIADPKFQSIVFAEPSKDSDPNSQLASTIRAFRYFLKYLSLKDGQEELGTWLWTPTLQLTPEYTVKILDEAKNNGVNVIYLSIDSYLDIFAMTDGDLKENMKEKFSLTLDNFIEEANKRGIAVNAEGGWRNWAEPGHEYKAFTIVSYVKEFNREHENRFRGFQYDVEPYLLEEYNSKPNLVLQNFLKLVDKTEEFLEEDELELSVVVPAFYDKRDISTPIVSYNGADSSVLEHLFKILDRKKDSSIIIMSYRNFAQGSDGSIEISSNELKTARDGLYSTDVIIAQETGNFLPRYITFYGMGKGHFNTETALLINAFEKNLNFGGLAIHYVNSLSELK